jgi:hypothetical protein
MLNAFEWVLNTPWTLVSVRECQWVSIEHPLNTHWVQMNANANEWVGTAPEHPMGAHDGHWVSVNTQWVRMTAIESLLNATHHGVTMRKISFVSEMNTLWMLVSACECLLVSDEHLLNACEYPWMPMSEHWTPPEHPLSAHECQLVSGNNLWTPMVWAWMPLSKYFKGLNAHL